MTQLGARSSLTAFSPLQSRCSGRNHGPVAIGWRQSKFDWCPRRLQVCSSGRRPNILPWWRSFELKQAKTAGWSFPEKIIGSLEWCLQSCTGSRERACPCAASLCPTISCAGFNDTVTQAAPSTVCTIIAMLRGYGNMQRFADTPPNPADQAACLH